MSRIKDKANMKRLIEQRDQLLTEMEAIKNKIAGLEMAISLLDGDSASIENSPKKRGRRGNVKDVLLTLLMESGTSGLNANNAVEIAARRGIDLDRASISSLLSRFKRDNIVQYDGEKYRLKQFSSSSQAHIIQ